MSYAVRSDGLGWRAINSQEDVLESEVFSETQPDILNPDVPVSITPRQGLIMLSRAGLLSSVQAAVAGMEGQSGEEARIDFERASEWRRDWPLLNALATALGMTSEQIDQMFISASSL
jgi:hypothetical protein